MGLDLLMGIRSSWVYAQPMREDGPAQIGQFFNCKTPGKLFGL